MSDLPTRPKTEPIRLPRQGQRVDDDLTVFGRDDLPPSEFACSMACFKKRYGGVTHAAIFGAEEVALAIDARGPSAGICVSCAVKLIASGRVW